MKTMLSIFALSAALLSGVGAAQAVPIPEPDALSYDLMTDAPEPVELAKTDFTPDEWAAMNPASADPQEDEPGWDCRIHGNKICGGTELTERPHLEEDDPGWDCELDGNRVCGPQEEGLEAEAWERFTPDYLPAEIKAQGFKATYMGTMPVDAPYLTDSWHTYHQSSKAGYNHVFSIELAR